MLIPVHSHLCMLQRVYTLHADMTTESAAVEHHLGPIKIQIFKAYANEITDSEKPIPVFILYEDGTSLKTSQP